MAEVEIRNLTRAFNIIEGSVIKQQLLYRDLNFRIESGCFAALVGASGSGKSTLLHIIGMLDSLDDRRRRTVRDAETGEPRAVAEVESSGQVLIDGQDVTGLTGARRARFINRNIGFIFQMHHLIPELTALQNIALPIRIANVSRSEAERRALELMAELELAQYAHKRPTVLSGGEQQRVAICRALANQPRVLLADEPTGSLHPSMKEDVMDRFVALQHERRITIILVTHDVQGLTDASGNSRVDRIITLRDQGAEMSGPLRQASAVAAAA